MDKPWPKYAYRSVDRRGSWPGSGRMGRTAASAFGTLCMEVYYRYARIYTR